MSTITITNPTTAVVEPTPINNAPISIEGNGEVVVNFPNVVNDGNTAKTLSWSISNIVNGTFVTFQTESDAVVNHNKSGTLEIQPNKTIKVRAYFNVPAGAPGVPSHACTADYMMQWV